jgi:hypothetical protein
MHSPSNSYSDVIRKTEEVDYTFETQFLCEAALAYVRQSPQTITKTQMNPI